MEVLFAIKVNVLLYQMAHSHIDQKLKSVKFVSQLCRVWLHKFVVLASEFLIAEDIDWIRPKLVANTEISFFLIPCLVIAELTTCQIRCSFLQMGQFIFGIISDWIVDN